MYQYMFYYYYVTVLHLSRYSVNGHGRKHRHLCQLYLEAPTLFATYVCAKNLSCGHHTVAWGLKVFQKLRLAGLQWSPHVPLCARDREHLLLGIEPHFTACANHDNM